ncbi:MAG TPA: hypothetical protein PKY89_05840 [Deltaproteobacteria bacterium]|nr:hypothetical protein [Deltaproteobacteria bacterium]
MALPKKRKKLENSNNSGSNAKVSKKSPAETAPAPKSPAGTSKSSKKMDKAFEIIEQIDSANGTTEAPEVQDPRPGLPGKIRFRISFDGSVPESGSLAENQGAAAKKPAEVNFGIPIPSIVWKVPILNKAVKKVLQKLSSQD